MKQLPSLEINHFNVNHHRDSQSDDETTGAILYFFFPYHPFLEIASNINEVYRVGWHWKIVSVKFSGIVHTGEYMQLFVFQ